jgi:hypothetical protein
MSEDTLTRELERRAGAVHGAPLTVADVVGRARSIRRRRRAGAAVAAAAAVAAIAVPSALLGGPDGTGPEPAPPPSPPAPSPAATAVLHDGVLTHPDGSTVPIDVETSEVTQLGVLTDGRVVVATSFPYGITVYAPDGTVESRPEVAANAITVSADDTLVAWIDDDARVVVLESGVPEPTTFEWGVPMAGEAIGYVDAVHGSGCAAGGCTVLVGDTTTTTHVLTQVDEPAADLVTSEPLRVASVSPDAGAWAVTFPPSEESEQFGCSGIYDPAAGVVVARSCDTTVGSLSPDGAHVTGARGDNQMWGSVDVLDTDLEVVASYDSGPDHVVKDWGWADSQHLLVSIVALREATEWTLLRVPIDGGEPEVVAGPVRAYNPDWPSAFQISD